MGCKRCGLRYGTSHKIDGGTIEARVFVVARGLERFDDGKPRTYVELCAACMRSLRKMVAKVAGLRTRAGSRFGVQTVTRSRSAEVSKPTRARARVQTDTARRRARERKLLGLPARDPHRR
jgi:hypothetical protein